MDIDEIEQMQNQGYKQLESDQGYIIQYLEEMLEPYGLHVITYEQQDCLFFKIEKE